MITKIQTHGGSRIWKNNVRRRPETTMGIINDLDYLRR